MAYAVQDDLLQQIPEDGLIQLTDDDRTGVVDSTKVARAIEDADAEIDGYLGKKYTVPIPSAPALVRNLSVTIAIYNLFSRRGEVDEGRERRYKNAVKSLENIAKGLISLGEVPAPTENPGESASFGSEDRVFTRDKMEGF